MPQNSKVTNNISYHTDGLYSEAGLLEFKNNVQVDEGGSYIPDDRSYVLLQDKFHSLIQFIGGQVTLKAASDIFIGAGQNLYFSVRGDVQWNYGGDKHEYIQGNHTVQYGEQTEEKQKAAKKLQELTKSIDKTKMDTIESEEGSDMPCPVCTQKFLTDRAQQISDKAFNITRKYLAKFPVPWDVIQKYVNMLIVPFLTTTPNSTLNGGQGCGSPGCKNGKVKSAITAIQNANDKAAKELESKQEEIKEQQKKLGTGGSQVQRYTGDVVIDVGLVPNDSETVVTRKGEKGQHVTPFGLVKSNGVTGAGLCLDSTGSADHAIHSDPLINPGSLVVNVANKLTVNGGSPGIEVNTSGKLQANAAVATIAATKGELVLTSANRTIIKGKNVIIDAKDGSGDNGCRIDADNTIVAGKLSVTGDIGLKGSLVMDGGLFCTHITCPSERLSTTPTGDDNEINYNATWNTPLNGNQATILESYDKLKKSICKDVWAAATLYIIEGGLSYLYGKIMDSYSGVMLKTQIDNQMSPTGFGVTGWYPYGVYPLQVVGVCSYGGAVTGYVVPGQLTPVFNFTHSHGSPTMDHTHDYSVPAFDGHANAASSRAAAPSPSHVPTPAKKKGMGTKPGDTNLGDIMSCGGGGAGFGGNVSAAKSKRNKAFNIAGDGNGFNGKNYVDLTPKTGNYSFNPDGSLNPAPNFNGLGNC
jgi:hypothetical protein